LEHGARVARSRARSSRPVVSVVIATYNRKASLAHAIDAVMAQDVEAELELIVVDNASTDGTDAYLAELMETCPREIVHARVDANLGPAGRNVGIELARGEFVAFTDSDCVPDPGWLRNALAAFDAPDVGMVQGRTEATHARAPLFSHYIVTSGLDGSFSTSNILYRRSALADLRFDGRCAYVPWGSPRAVYWEDTDLGWRVRARGWRPAFAASAVVRHEVVAIGAMRWLMWPRHFENLPEKAARFPDLRRHLFLRLWITPLNLCFELALLGLVLAPWRPLALVLALPYVVAFARTRGLRGRFPPGKVAAHVAWDFVTVGSLLLGSVRHRTLVL
jgi:glycosyltransferase involved in cell wall biosynthesis